MTLATDLPLVAARAITTPEEARILRLFAGGQHITAIVKATGTTLDEVSGVAYRNRRRPDGAAAHLAALGRAVEWYEANT